MVEVGLYEVAGNPNLTFIYFIAFVLVAALGLRFAVYAWRNRTHSDIAAQTPIWSHMCYVGLLAAAYGVVGIVGITTSLTVDAKVGLMLGTTLALAFTIRRVYTGANGGAPSTRERVGRVAFVGLVVVTAAVVAVGGRSDLSAALQGASALVFVAYGAVYYRRQAADARLRGTMLDSLLRHLLPVLTFAALVSVVALAVPAGLPRVVVLHVQVVFIIMTATALMTATIKLQQNLAGL